MSAPVSALKVMVAVCARPRCPANQKFRALGDAPVEIKIRHIGNCLKADPDYVEGVAAALGIPMSDVKK